jgi:hypothetical protein
MPGITGLISKKILGDEEKKIESMLNCMLHASPLKKTDPSILK